MPSLVLSVHPVPPGANGRATDFAMAETVPDGQITLIGWCDCFYAGMARSDRCDMSRRRAATGCDMSHYPAALFEESVEMPPAHAERACRLRLVAVGAFDLEGGTSR